MNVSRYATPAALACAATLLVAASATHAQVPRKPALPAADVTRPATPLHPAEADDKDTQRRVNPVNQPPAVPAGVGAQAVQNESLRARETRAQVETPQVRQPMQAVQPLPAPPRQAYIPVIGTQSGSGEPAASEQQALTAVPAGTAIPRSGVVVPTATHSTTGLAGKSGDNTHLIDLYQQGMFIHRIVWKEDMDRPCVIYVEGAKVMRQADGSYLTSNETGSEEKTFSCDGKGFVSLGGGTISILGGQTKEVRTDALRPIQAIGVCNNNSNNSRMKGVRIRGGHIAPWDQNAINVATQDEAQMANCRRWNPETPVSCASNMRATGVVVYTKDNRNITGLQLICRGSELR